MSLRVLTLCPRCWAPGLLAQRKRDVSQKRGLSFLLARRPAGPSSHVSWLPALSSSWTLSPLTAVFLMPLSPLPTHCSSHRPRSVSSKFRTFAQLFHLTGRAPLSESPLTHLLFIKDFSEPQKGFLQKQPVCQKDPRGPPTILFWCDHLCVISL